MRTINLTVLFALSALAANASAGPLPNLNGSDTLEPLTKAILAACPGVPGGAITYVGGGSSVGENEMLAGKQQIAPMSRFLGANACTSANPDAAGMAFAQDALLVVAKSTSAAGGGGLGSNWKDTLKLLYAGVDAGGAKDCNSAARQTLVSKYANLFAVPASISNQTEPVRHAFRRDDLSGTTDTFLSVLGLPALIPPPNALPLQNPAGPTTFCNGYDFEDNDPIRRACDANEEVCGADGKLGVVLPITVPTEVNTGAGVNPYNNTACTAGVFKWMPVPKRWTAFAGPTPGPNKRLCPNGNPITFTKCLTPVTRTGTTPANFVFTPGCLNPATNKGAPPVADGRVYNLTPRKADGALFTTSRPAPLGPPNGNYKDFESGFYRIHSTKSFTAGTTCARQDSTEQIGCLTAASPFSVGFAGLDSTKGAPGLIEGLSLAGNAPPPAGAIATYPFSRKLWLNTVKGFAAVTAPELDLAKCFAGSGLSTPLATVVTNAGFIPQTPTCQKCDGTPTAC